MTIINAINSGPLDSAVFCFIPKLGQHYTSPPFLPVHRYKDEVSVLFSVELPPTTKVKGSIRVVS